MRCERAACAVQGAWRRLQPRQLRAAHAAAMEETVAALMASAALESAAPVAPAA